MQTANLYNKLTMLSNGIDFENKYNKIPVHYLVDIAVLK